VVLQDLAVVADGVNQAFTLVDGEGNVLEENRANGELNLLSNETGSNTQSANTIGIVVSNNPHLSPGRHLLDLLDELALVSVEEMVEHNGVGEFLGSGGRRGEVPSNDDALASREVLDEDLTGGDGLEFGSELLYAARKNASSRRVAS